MNLLTDDLLKVKEFNDIIDTIKRKNENITFKNIIDLQKAYLVYSIAKKANKSCLVVCSNLFNANKMMQDLKFFSDIQLLFFPELPLIYYDVEAQSKDIQNDRMYVLQKIDENQEKKIIVTTIDTLSHPMKPKSTQIDDEIVISKNTDINFDKLVEKLVEFGYERADVVEGKGQFAVRGGIIDIFSISNDMPVRVEFFGDTVDSIRTFDVMTQRSISNLEKINILRISEFVLNNSKLIKIKEELNKYIVKSKNNELNQNIKKDIELIENGILDNLIDKYFNLLVDTSANFLDYLDDYVIYLDEPDRCKEKVKNLCYENSETLKILSQRNYLATEFANKYMPFEKIEEKISEHTNVYLQNQVTDFKQTKRIVFDFKSKEMYFYKNSFETLLLDVKSLSGKKILLVFPTQTRIEQVKNYLIDNGIKVEILENIWKEKKLKEGTVYLSLGIVSSGFYSSFNDLAIISEVVSGIKKKSRNESKKLIGTQINSFDDLNVGDFVVHENHGIGIYRGIKSINIQDVIKDYMQIEYANNGYIYIPINQIELVKKYVCDDNAKPKINSLGTKEWEKTKQKVTKHVKEVAKELISLYAKREKSLGFAFSKDTPWQKEFEDSFEYELTDDQRQAVQEVKADMEEQAVMDRLLCGDVGYGKTEVALRVAFKAVMDKKQVAYLVPTTVLCLQQYRTFKERMEKFGVKVEMLSRFRTKKQQTQILKDLVDGKIDVLVGTHRILSSDVFFKDLGLLVIDEEHRFGVKAKESIKKLKESVDVLSMTATPIPRTLHMSMIGIRGMSTLTEPPLERLPVHTYVMEYDDTIIKEAIEKELLRDGQVFYLNNRVEGIEELTAKVKRLVPNARVAFAHGQMEPRQIEDIMLKFINHEFDVIVCTSILESGIDIQNANTLIVENSDRLGLAQLYQIRGRVGRSSRLAYAYITYQKNKQISEIADKRLKAIRDFTEFGSGFKIALRDLEIRGAGNILGKEQHGHMVKVGYDMYLALLEKAILDEKNENNVDKKEEVEKEIKIDLDISAYISDSYIKDPIQKISMYKKISDIKDKETMLDVVDELIDRYGEIPKETENLIKIVEIRNLARKAGVTRICSFGEILKIEPFNLKIYLTNFVHSDILIRVQIELEKLIKEKGKYNE